MAGGYKKGRWEKGQRRGVKGKAAGECQKEDLNKGVKRDATEGHDRRANRHKDCIKFRKRVENI